MSGESGETSVPANTKESREGEPIKQPPKSKREILKHLGPSFVITASVVGSGELIATTALGARAGIVVLWFLVLSLVLKVGLQYQISKHVVLTDKTIHEIFDEIPGEIFGHSWTWWWSVSFWTIIANVTRMGIFGGATVLLYELFNQAVPQIFLSVAIFVFTVGPLLLGYDFVENISAVFVFALSALTVAAALLTFGTQFSLSLSEIAYGLSFNLPSGGFITLVGAIGLTGINAGELTAYALFVKQSGYSTHNGPRDSDGWADRVNGWLKVLKADILLSTLLIVITTVSFFLLGVTILSTFGTFPEGPRLAVYLARAYESIFGTIGYVFLLITGFAALYTTLIGTGQTSISAWSDWVQQTRWGNKYSTEQISKAVAIGLPTVWFVGGNFTNYITAFVIISGLFTSTLYIPEVITAIWTLQQEQDEVKEVHTRGATKIGVWVSLIGTFLLVVTALLLTVLG